MSRKPTIRDLQDCDDPWGYIDLLATLADPNDPEHDAMLEWLGGGFHPDACDLDAVNRRLAAAFGLSP